MKKDETNPPLYFAKTKVNVTNKESRNYLLCKVRVKAHVGLKRIALIRAADKYYLV